MRSVITSRLWLGTAADARNLPQLHDIGIIAVVDLALDEPAAQPSRDLIYCRFPLVDGAENGRPLLVAAIKTLASLIECQLPTVVACSAGMSRSPAIAAAALALFHRTSPEEELANLITAGPRDVTPQLWSHIVAALQEITTA